MEQDQPPGALGSNAGLGIFDEEHMRFSTVELRPAGCKRDKWEVGFADLDGDRVNECHGPHSLGFYHYPRRMGKEKAFEALRAHLVAKHEDEIAALTKSLGKLKALKMPNAELSGQTRPARKDEDGQGLDCRVCSA